MLGEGPAVCVAGTSPKNGQKLGLATDRFHDIFGTEIVIDDYV